jgi:UDP-2,3-diacylglucosamine pyrophosphatase LpxH
MAFLRKSRERFIADNLKRLYEDAPCLEIGRNKRFVIFSDLHLGNGGKNDDFRGNAALFSSVLEQYYLENDYTLILNGDIEELQKFRLPAVKKQWRSIFSLFDAFVKKDRFLKIVGNHDVGLLHQSGSYTYPLYQSIRFHYGENTLYVLHGHQASVFFTKHNDISGFLIKYLAQPLGIKNITAAHDSSRRYATEQRIYEFSAENKIVSIIGHTHRPLFESLSKIDSIKFRIEMLCRAYPDMDDEEKRRAEITIKRSKEELQHIYEKDDVNGNRSSLYNTRFLVPCLFNSGCVIGKRGITALEIGGDEIALVHWFDKTVSSKYFSPNGDRPVQLGNTTFYRTVLKQDVLSYIFTRIQLLT